MPESKKKTADFCDMKVMYNCPFRIIVSFGSCYGTNRCLETVKTEPHPSESRLLKYTYVLTSCCFPEIKLSFAGFSVTFMQRVFPLKCQNSSPNIWGKLTPPSLPKTVEHASPLQVIDSGQTLSFKHSPFLSMPQFP